MKRTLAVLSTAVAMLALVGCSRVSVETSYGETGIEWQDIKSWACWPYDAKKDFQRALADRTPDGGSATDTISFATESQVNVAAQANAVAGVQGIVRMAVLAGMASQGCAPAAAALIGEGVAVPPGTGGNGP